MALLTQSCLHHAGRPAVARCPSCSQSYCRECVVEHDYKLICASCLARVAEAVTRPGKKPGRFPIAAVIQFALALFAGWLIVQLVADIIMSLPSDIHDGLIWEQTS